LTHEERETLIDAMSVHYLHSRDDLRTMARSGGSPWSKLVDEFYRSNPGWTAEGWRGRVKTPYVSTGAELSKPGDLSDEQIAGIAIAVIIVVVGLIIWAWLNFMQHP
jgi:hypothetical protein